MRIDQMVQEQHSIYFGFILGKFYKNAKGLTLIDLALFAIKVLVSLQNQVWHINLSTDVWNLKTIQLLLQSVP